MASEYASASLTVDVGKCVDPCYVIIELDEYANDGKTSFLKEDVAFFKVYSNTYPEVGSTGGTLQGYDENGIPITIYKVSPSDMYGVPTVELDIPEISETITEEVVFEEWSSAATKAIMLARISEIEWKGVELGDIVVDRDDLRSLKVIPTADPITGKVGKGYGVADITYSTTYRSYSIACSAAMSVVVYVYGTTLGSPCESPDPLDCILEREKITLDCTETHATLVVEFGEEEPECVIQVELDSKLNNSKTVFELREPAYFRVYANCATKLKGTCMTPSLYELNVGELVENEFINFSNGIGNATRPVRNIRGYEWIGNGLGKVRAVDRSTTLASATTDESGVLKLTYETVYNSYYVTSIEEGVCLITVAGSSGSASVDVDVSELEIPEETLPSPSATFLDCTDTEATLSIEFGEGEKKYEVIIAAQDAITGEIIPGATVIINDGEYSGITDENGIYVVGKMAVGTHTVKITAEGYTVTNVDGLDNDTFVVTEVEE